MKLKLSTYKIAAVVVWAVCLGFIGVGMLVSGGSRAAALQQAARNLQESQEKLAFAQSAGKDDAKQRAMDRLTQAQRSLDTFSCPAAAESALIFQIGQVANTLQLKKFTSRFPETTPEKTLEKSDWITEGWLNIEFVADYLRTAAFINSLERNEPALFIESLHLRRSDDNVEEASVRMTVSYLIRTPDKKKAAAQACAAQ